MAPRMNPAALFRRGATFAYVQEVPYALGALGEEPAMTPSAASLEAQLAAYQSQLTNAQTERAACDRWSALDVAGAIFTMGGSAIVTKGFCIAKWDGQIGFFKDRITETNAALIIARAADAEAAQLQAEAQARGTTGKGRAGSTSSAFTGGSGSASAGGIPTWAKAAGGIVLLGALGYFGSKLLKRKS